MIVVTAKEAREIFDKVITEKGEDATILLTYWSEDAILKSCENLGVGLGEGDVELMMKLDADEIFYELSNREEGICTINEQLDDIVQEHLDDDDD